MKGKSKALGFAETRVVKDLEEINSLVGVKIHFPDENNLLHFLIRVKPESGIWSKGQFDFEFQLSSNFPFERPKVKCLTKLWHPNIDLDGSICLNILRDNYTPAMSIAILVVGLQYLFASPNPDDPLNKEAAKQYKEDFNRFVVRAEEYMSMYCPTKPLGE